MKNMEEGVNSSIDIQQSQTGLAFFFEDRKKTLSRVWQFLWKEWKADKVCFVRYRGCEGLYIMIQTTKWNGYFTEGLDSFIHTQNKCDRAGGFLNCQKGHFGCVGRGWTGKDYVAKHIKVWDVVQEG